MTTLSVGSATDVGRLRSNNQDTKMVAPELTLYGVADGMGGHQGGEVASAMAVELVERNAGEPTVESLVRAVKQANRAIFEKAGSDTELHGMGTTLVAIRVVAGAGDDGDEIAWINVGDSRVYLLRDDNLIQLSHDHSLVEDLVRDGQLTPDEAAVHPQRNILTRALGIDLDVDVDTGTVLPFTGDRFLLCSDGLFNEVSNDQMASVLRRLADPDEAAEELVRLANEGGGRDNITVVVADVTDDGGRAAAASAILAETAGSGHDPTRAIESVPPPASSRADDPDPQAADPFRGARSSLPEAHDDYGADTDDPFDSLKGARTRRLTWGVVAFVLLLLVIVGLIVGAVTWSARSTFYVGFEGDRVAVYKGKPDGVLWIDPTLERTTSIRRSEVPPALRAVLDEGKEFGSEGDTTTTTPTTTTAPTTASTTTAPASTPTTSPPP